MVAISACAARAQDSTPVADIEAAKERTPLSPYLYGQFVEHAGNLIYTTLWCEMLDDRKFFFPVMLKPADDTNAPPRGGGFGGRRRGVGPGRWNPVGPVDSVVMDTNRPFVGDHTPLIKLAGDEPRGIRQTGLSFFAGQTYRGRVQLAGDSTARVFIRIVWGTNADMSGDLGISVPVASELDTKYRKCDFSFVANQSDPARIEIVGTGTGSFHLGAVSLMPADNVAGWQPEAIAALKSLRSGVYRFPGGNFVSAHEWQNAIGDPDKRPPKSPGDAETFQWINLMRGDTMLMSLTNHRYLATTPNRPGPVTAIATGPSPARQQGECFKWKTIE